MEGTRIPTMCRLCLSRKPFFYKIIDKKNNWPTKIKELTGIDINVNLRLCSITFI